MDLIITILPVVTKDLPISPRFTPYDFLSRCKNGGGSGGFEGEYAVTKSSCPIVMMDEDQ